MRQEHLLAAALGASGLISGEAWGLTSDISGGVTTTLQADQSGRADTEGQASFDMYIDSRLPKGTLSIYLEGSTSRFSNGVASVYGEANADAGTALIADEEGNIQVSELKYRYPLTEARAITIGVVDPSAYMDLAFTANNQNIQFLGTDFVNNPAIEFPDYSPGVIYQQRLDPLGSEVFALLTSSNGLADNPSASYAQLFNIDEADKGAFVALGGRWRRSNWSAELGAWSHTAPHQSLKGSGQGRHNYGIYTVVGRDTGRYGFDVRAGFANPEVYAARAYGSVTFAWRQGRMQYGAGYSHTFLSSDLKGDPDRADIRHGELYARYAATDTLGVTLDLQRIINSGFDATDAVRESDALIGGVRLDWMF